MNLIVVVLACLLAAARADCDACIDGWCYSSKTLLQGLHGSPAMDIDRNNSVLYVQINPNIIAAYFLEEAKVQLIDTPDTTGLAVNQNTQVLYTSGANSWYTFELGSNITQINTNLKFYKQAELLTFNNDILIYTEKCCKGLSNFQNNSYFDFSQLYNFKITDVVRGKKSGLYFVANDTVYNDNVKFANKKYVLSVDKSGEIYFADVVENIIYKLNSTNKQLDSYVVYRTGQVGKLVFDNNNNIIYHNLDDGTVNKWNPEHTECTVDAPHSKYKIVRDHLDTSCNEVEPPNQYQY